MASRSLFGDQRGFTIIEVLVAATLLVVGVLGTMAMVDSSNAETQLSGGREGATNLAREVVEGARTLGYDDLLPATLDTKLQALPGLATTTPGSWTVRRRGITYAVTTSLCSVDDPKDGYGSHAGATYCADSSTTGTTDPQAEDFKRLTVDASWTRNSGTQKVRQVALIDSPSTKGPGVSSLVTTPPTVVANPAAPKITSASVTSASFKATAPPGVASMIYSLDGEDKGTATKQPNGTDWMFTLPLPASLSDGGYDVSVRALDDRGVVGPSFTIPMTLIRGQPAAPTGLVGGPNTIYVNGTPTSVTEIEWDANSERNVIGYRVYNASGGLVCPASTQTLSLKLSCYDASAANGGNYTIRALYRNASDVISEGPASPYTTDPTVPRTFYFKNTTFGNLTNCSSATAQRDMEEGFPGLDPEAAFKGLSTATQTLNFCSPPFTEGEKLRAGPANISIYVNNTASGKNTACVLTGQLSRVGGTSTTLASPPPTTIGANASVTNISGSMGDVAALTLSAGDRLNLKITWAKSDGCAATNLHYGGTSYRSSLSVSSDRIAPPNPPTGLSATTLADGTTRLSWSPPAYGNPISFYRIYRDGIDYTNRLDVVDPPIAPNTPSYDDDPGGSTHTYFVTAVSDKLAESAKSGSVAK